MFVSCSQPDHSQIASPHSILSCPYGIPGRLNARWRPLACDGRTTGAEMKPGFHYYLKIWPWAHESTPHQETSQQNLVSTIAL